MGQPVIIQASAEDPKNAMPAMPAMPSKQVPWQDIIEEIIECGAPVYDSQVGEHNSNSTTRMVYCSHDYIFGG